MTPALATALFVLAALSGMRYRRTWQREGPAWQLWLYGSVAAGCLLVLAFLPLRAG